MRNGFLDESGIHVSSGHSCIALVYVEADDIVSLESAVLAIEKTMNIYPFHWSHTNWRVRERFLHEICKKDFSVKIAIIQNPFSGEHYKTAIRHLIIEKDMDRLIIDGKKSHHHVTNFKKVLRDRGVTLKKLIMGNDHSYPVLRIADLCAGLARSYHERSGDLMVQKLYGMLKPKIVVTIFE